MIPDFPTKSSANPVTPHTTDALPSNGTEPTSTPNNNSSKMTAKQSTTRLMDLDSLNLPMEKQIEVFAREGGEERYNQIATGQKVTSSFAGLVSLLGEWEVSIDGDGGN